MARVGFYNENEYRDYPFRTQTAPLDIAAYVRYSSSSSASSVSAPSSSSAAAVPLYDLPSELIVDFGAIMGVASDYSDARGDFVYLYRLRRAGDYVLFEFRTTADSAKMQSLYFVRSLNDPEFKQDWAESQDNQSGDPTFPFSLSSSSVSASVSSSATFCDRETVCDAPTRWKCGGPGCQEPRWEGFLITGRFEALADMLADGDELVFAIGLWAIEPARVQNLNKSFVQSINIANRDRARHTPPPGCGSSASAYAEVMYVNRLCMQGDIAFKEGFNCLIRQDNNNNTLTFNGQVGAGAGEPCEEVPLYPGETAPADSRYLGGGPACDETIRTVNGKGGPTLRLLGGPGVRVYDSPTDPSTVFVDANLNTFAVCLTPELQPGDPCYVSSSSSSASSAGAGP